MNNTQNARVPKIGDVYMAMFDGDDSEQTGLRPALIFQNNVGNRHSPNVIVLPLTSKVKKKYLPTHVIVPANGTGLDRTSMVLCENPMCISKNKLGAYRTTLPNEYMKKIAEAHLLATSAISFVDPEVMATIWEKASKLNSVT